MNDDANPYAPPAPEEERDSDIVLARNEAYRVVGNKLHCRRGMERFPGICWLTGSTEPLVGVHSKNGRYLPKRAFRLSVVASVVWMIAVIQIGASHTIIWAGIAVMFAFDLLLNRTFGKPYDFMVGETELGRKNRRRFRWFAYSWFSLLAAQITAFTDIDSFGVLAFLTVPAAGALGVAFLWIRPKRPTVVVREASPTVIVVQGLTKEFLEALQRKDVY
jgi:hypothetical protein